MRLDILGPVQASAAGVRVDIGRPRRLAVVGVLSLSANRVVSMAAMTEALWGGAPPSTARAQIHAEISAIRGAFRAAGNADRISTRPGGYLLSLSDGELDLEAFIRDVAFARGRTAEGDLTAAVSRLRAAQRLWRGQALGGAAGAYVDAARARLDEHRLAAFEDLAELELQLAHHHDLVPMLHELVAAQPLRERLRGQLMLALHRSGRQAEALGLMRELRDLLAEEQGLDPGQEILRLEQMILRRDAVVEPVRRSEPPVRAGMRPAPSIPGAAVAVPDQLPADCGDFVGRTAERERLGGLLSSAVDGAPGRPVVVGISGMGGMGKTALAVTVAWQVRHAFADGCLFADLHGDGHHPVDAHMTISSFLRALGVPPTAQPADRGDLLGFYRSVMSRRKVLVVLDNASTEAQVRPLIPPSGGSALVVTSRRSMAALATAAMVTLDRLSVDEAVELVGKAAGGERIAAEPHAVRRLVELCGHIPLAVRIAGARLRSRPDWTLSALADRLADERRRLDELRVGDLDARASVAVSYDRLDPTARRGLRLLALLPRGGFAPAIGAATLELDVAVAEAIVATLVDEHLLRGHVSTGQPRFVLHDLVRLFGRQWAMAEDGDEACAAALGRAHGTYLRLARAANDALPSGRFVADPPAPDSPSLSPAQAITWFEAESAALLDCVAEAVRRDRPEVAADIVAAMTNFFMLQSRFVEWREAIDLVLGSPANWSGRDRRRASLLHSRGLLLRETGANDEALADFRRARAHYRRSGASVAAAATATEIGVCARKRGQARLARAAFDHAIAFFNRHGDTRQAGYAHLGLGNLLYDFGPEAPGFTPAYERACVVFRATGERSGLANGLGCLGLALRRAGQADRAIPLLAESIELYDQQSDRVYGAVAREALADALLAAGRAAAAREQLDLVLPILAGAGQRWAWARALRTLGRLHLAGGEPASALVVLQQAVDEFHLLGQPVGAGLSALWLAKARLAMGDHAGATETGGRALTLLTGARSPFAAEVVEWLASVPPLPSI